ncbi:MAG: hypothetical protein AAGC67_18350 [Myxococcota bacterium]
MGEPNDDFYVGYRDRAPEGLARFLRVRVLVLLVAAPLLLAVLAAAQKGFAPSLFEFGVEREFTGWITTEPVPALVSLRPGNTAHCGAVSTWPLVSLGKFGAEAAVAGFEGRAVRVRGTLVHVDESTMIELAEDGLEAIDAPTDPGAPRPDARVESLGEHRLEGEIVDSKCYYGVMNPGSGKVHRGCATRCISGGIPPALLVRDDEGGRVTLLMVDRSGRSLGDRVLDRVGRPVSVAGEVVRYDDLLVVRVDPEQIRRAGR